MGLKENVIIGKLIPAGTGMERYRNVEVERASHPGDEFGEFNLSDTEIGKASPAVDFDTATLDDDEQMADADELNETNSDISESDESITDGEISTDDDNNEGSMAEEESSAE